MYRNTDQVTEMEMEKLHTHEIIAMAYCATVQPVYDTPQPCMACFEGVCIGGWQYEDKAAVIAAALSDAGLVIVPDGKLTNSEDIKYRWSTKRQVLEFHYGPVDEPCWDETVGGWLVGEGLMLAKAIGGYKITSMGRAAVRLMRHEQKESMYAFPDWVLSEISK